MHFAETHGVRRGGRVFNVDILETPELDLPNLYIAAEAGQNTALVKTIPAVVTTISAIRIRTSSVWGEPLLSAVEVLPAG